MDGHEADQNQSMDNHEPLGLGSIEFEKAAFGLFKLREIMGNWLEIHRNVALGQQPQLVGHGRPTVTAARA